MNIMIAEEFTHEIEENVLARTAQAVLTYEGITEPVDKHRNR